MRIPSPLTLLVACTLLAALFTHLLPAGEFDRRDDPATGRRVPIAGTYHAVEPAPVGLFDAVVAVPRGMADAAAVIFFVFLVGGGFTVVERTGALGRLVHWLVARLGDREALVIPICCVVFGLGGVLIQMQEELIAFVPLLLLLMRRLRYDALTAVAVSLGAAAVGAAFSPVNPFQVVIAQKVAELPPQSGMGFRLVFLGIAMALWIWMTLRHAQRIRGEAAPGTGTAAEPRSAEPLSVRDGAVLATVLGTFAAFIYGAQRFGWDFEQFAALFFLMGVVGGLLGGLGVTRTADGFVEGFRALAFAALLIGFARSIYVVLEQGHIIDTIVSAIFAPLANLPVAVCAVGMMFLQAAVHVPVPSTSGQAVLTLPVLVPLSDLLALSRQVTVLAYQYGAGLCELLTPTNGALMAMLAAAGVGYDAWLRFLWRAMLLLAGVGVSAILMAVAIQLH